MKFLASAVVLAGTIDHKLAGLLVRKQDRAVGRTFGLLLLALQLSAAWAQTAPGTTANAASNSMVQTVRAVLISDVHFDPFRDPAKVSKLLAAPVLAWQSILDAPSSMEQVAKRATDPAAKQDADQTMDPVVSWQQVAHSCNAGALDTDEALLNTSIASLGKLGRGAGFIALSGDLMAHGFDCKFHAVLPRANADAYRSLSEKTIEYVLLRLRHALPEAALYPALGNNDSDCGDYRLDAGGSFLADLAPDFTQDVPLAEREQALTDFRSHGSYRTTVAGAPMLRLAVLDDLFLSRKYSACSGKQNESAGESLVAWLAQQIESSRATEKPLWVMGHIPTGVDPFATAMKMRNVCAGQKPEMFLSSNHLDDVLADAGDVVRLALFAHTHMDEMRVLAPAREGRSRAAVPLKFAPSISPINGNLPSYMLATVDAKSGTMLDYKVIAATNAAGAAWAESYDYQTLYHQPDYSAASVRKLVEAMESDPEIENAVSKAYLKGYFLHGGEALLRLFWPEYVCSLANTSAEDFSRCVCRSAH